MRLLIVLLIGAAFYIVLRLVFLKNWYKGLDVKIDFEHRTIREGEKNTLSEVVRNDKAMPMPVVLVKFAITRTFVFPRESNSSVTDQYYRKEYFSLRPYQRITRKYTFTATRRGEFGISSINLICKDFFLFHNYTGGFDNRLASVLVLPARIRQGEIPQEIIRLNGEIIQRVKLNEDPFAFQSIREYQPFDPMNHINWKASAKTGFLEVNTFHSTNQRNVVLLLNLEGGSVRRGDTIAEASIKIASTLASVFVSEHIPTALCSNGIDKDSKEKISIGAGCDEGHIYSVDVALARIELQEAYASFHELILNKVEEFGENNDYIIISNSLREEIRDTFRHLQEKGVKISFIIPEYHYVNRKDFRENGMDIVKWEIDDEG